MQVHTPTRADSVVALGMCCVRLLGAFAELRKATISYVVSVRPSKPPPPFPSSMEHLGSHRTDIDETLYLSFFFFRKSKLY
jgi:hypothetical protein